MEQEILACETCPISLNKGAEKLAYRMCPVVSGKVLSGLGRVGVDVSSDPDSGLEILDKMIALPAVQKLASEECGYRLQQHESTRRGYSAMVY